jgi:LAGLIDADG DNA endonuclease family protein
VNPLDLAWLAGFIDGDGCVSISKNTRGVYPLIRITQRDRWILEHVKEIAGGWTAPHQTTGFKPGSIHYVWGISGKKAVELAGRLVQYSVAKRGQLELLAGWPGRDQRALTTEDRDGRASIREKIHVLNSGGRESGKAS